MIQTTRSQCGRLLPLLAALGLSVPAAAKDAVMTLPGGGFAKANELAIQSAWAATHVIVPGETLKVAAKLRNDGFAPAREVVARMCLSSGACSTRVLPLIDAAATATVEFDLPMGAELKAGNPHFLQVKVDPDNRVAETNEEDNTREFAKPILVVDLEHARPQLPIEHDDVIELADGIAKSHRRTDYPDGAPAKNAEVRDEYKSKPHPVTGYQESLKSGVAGQPRLDPRVVEADRDAPEGQRLQYVVKYRHGVRMPELPLLPDATERFSRKNIETLARRAGMFEAVRRARTQAAGELSAAIRRAQGRVLEYYTLAGSMLVDAPKGMLELLNANRQVLHVEAVDDGTRPPDTVADGRDRIDSDPYFNGGATGAGFLALLDSGVRNTHTLLTGPDHIWFEEDCVNGDANCNNAGAAAYDADDDCWDHGTSSAAILTGNGNLGNDNRGVSSGWLDSWKVYPGNCGGLNTTAVLRGYDQAVLWGDQIVVAEMQSSQGETGSIAQAADDAFDAGTLTIAANGNNGPNAGTVNSPANAHKALGVGNYDVDSGAAIGSQSAGPTADNRYKPDLQAPTNTDTASTTSNTAINNFGGTSGATPYAAGAASVFSDWFNKTALTAANAGKIYAALINSGPLDWGSWNNTEGVGKFALPLNGTLYTGSRNVSNWDNEYVTINVPANATEISVAIWWPEDSNATHRDIDLYLQRPDGSTSANSISIPSVFEHIKVSAPIVPGYRDVRIYGYSVPAFVSQTVYYAIHVK